MLLKRHKAQRDNPAVAQKHPDWKLSTELVRLGDLNNSGDIDVGDFLKITRYIVAKKDQVVRNRHAEWLKLK